MEDEYRPPPKDSRALGVIVQVLAAAFWGAMGISWTALGRPYLGAASVALAVIFAYLAVRARRSLTR